VTKSQTGIPFAREAADLLFGAEGAALAREEAAKAPMAELMRLHFEDRYRSIDEVLSRGGLTRVIELAAGLSFRGLSFASRTDVIYVDTDLPEIVALKTELVRRLHPAPLKGVLRIEPLDALDGNAFGGLVDSLPPGPLAIVNEGLLVYFDEDEKAKLASNVLRALRLRSGVWITADIYVRNSAFSSLPRDPRTRRFLEEHRVEENKFASWDEAAAFFERSGFEIQSRLSHSANRRARETWVLGARSG
jgi:O-methyltransferase involved in polyketide biosynthesis